MLNGELRVGIADCKIGIAPERIITVGLGSCIGIAIYDSYKKIGGLAHIMLPDSTQFSKITNKFKFADLAVPILVEELIKKGANKRKLQAKICGGASMFNFSDKSMIMEIGSRNIDAVKKALKENSIPIAAEDVGGKKGRTMILDTSEGVVSIKIIGQGIKDI